MSEVNPSRCCIVHHISEIKRLSDVATSISPSTTSCYIKAEYMSLPSWVRIHNIFLRGQPSGRTSQIEYLDLRCSIIVSRESNKAYGFCKNSSHVEKIVHIVVPNMEELAFRKNSNSQIQVSASSLPTCRGPLTT